MSVAGNIEVINPVVRNVFTNTAENDLAIFVDTPTQAIHIGCTSNATVPSTVMVTSSNLVLNGDILFPNRLISLSRLRVTQPSTLVTTANISSSYSAVPGLNPSNGSNYDFSLPVTVSNFRFLSSSTGNICASLGSNGSWYINNLFTNNIVRLNSNGALSNITGLTMSNGQVLAATVDTASAPGFAWNGDTNTGLYHIANGQIGVSVSGAQVASFSNGGVVVSGTVNATSIISGGYNVITTNGGTINGTLGVTTLNATTLTGSLAATNITGILDVSKGGTSTSTVTGSGSVVLSSSPNLSSPYISGLFSVGSTLYGPISASWNGTSPNVNSKFGIKLTISSPSLTTAGYFNNAAFNITLPTPGLYMVTGSATVSANNWRTNFTQKISIEVVNNTVVGLRYGSESSGSYAAIMSDGDPRDTLYVFSSVWGNTTHVVMNLNFWRLQS